MELLSAKETAAKWGISQRRVIALCSEGRVPHAQLVGNSWVIPKSTKKPSDARTNEAKEIAREARPFLKWAGGKGQLLSEISKYYPFEKQKRIKKYAEPFVGGGAVLFDILNKYDIDEVYISDINAELINTYKTVRDNAAELINTLKQIEHDYLALNAESRKNAYFKNRARFNEMKRAKIHNIESAALMIFLNKTCFNGIYRVNSSGDYNVPMGAYKNPLICNELNLIRASKKLQKATIVCGDYKESSSFIDKNTFVYFDPPYRPLSKTSSFASYTEHLFGDDKQLELASFVQELNNKGALIVVSNSDPKNTNTDDDFFENAYSGRKIERVSATRMLNRNCNDRGKVSELLISNF